MTKVLIVEDDFITRELVAEIVESVDDLVAITSPNGKHAYETLTTNDDIKLMITDMMMPEMSGSDLIKTLRGTCRFADLPVIIISSIVGVNDIANLLDLGASLFQPKPIEKDLLIKNMQYCLKSSLQQIH